jgi:regulatory protein
VPEKNCLEEAMGFLDRHAYSERKLAAKLKTIGFLEADINECLDRFKSWGYINDREFGVNRIRQLQERLKSRLFTMQDLETQGLPKDIISELISCYYPEEQELAIARKLILKRTTSPEKQLKTWAYLVRAGFSENTVRHCFPGIDPT